MFVITVNIMEPPVYSPHEASRYIKKKKAELCFCIFCTYNFCLDDILYDVC